MSCPGNAACFWHRALAWMLWLSSLPESFLAHVQCHEPANFCLSRKWSERCVPVCFGCSQSMNLPESFFELIECWAEKGCQRGRGWWQGSRKSSCVFLITFLIPSFPNRGSSERLQHQKTKREGGRGKENKEWVGGRREMKGRDGRFLLFIIIVQGVRLDHFVFQAQHY